MDKPFPFAPFNISKKRWVMAVDKPEDIDVLKHIGKWVKVSMPNGDRKGIEIMDIKGNMTYPTKFEIHTKDGNSYFISMLDFFAQMNGEKIDDATIQLFDETQFEVKTPELGEWLNRKKKQNQES